MSRRRSTGQAACRVARRLALALLCSGLVGASPVALRAQADALTLTEVIELRRRGVPTRRILRSAQDYCVAFAVDDSVERELVAAGADTMLIGGIRQACVMTLPMVKLAPGVMLDDNFSAMSGLPPFTAPDRLCSARPGADGLRMENRRLGVGCAIGYPFDLGGTNVRIELTIGELLGKRGAMAALGFGKSDDSWEQYSFTATNDDRVEVCQSDAGRCRALLSHKRTSSASAAPTAPAGAPLRAMRSAEMRLTIEIRGRLLSFYVGDELVGTHSAREDIVGSLSLGVGSRSTALFTRLRVERIEEVATPQ